MNIHEIETRQGIDTIKTILNNQVSYNDYVRLNTDIIALTCAINQLKHQVADLKESILEIKRGVKNA